MIYSLILVVDHVRIDHMRRVDYADWKEESRRTPYILQMCHSYSAESMHVQQHVTYELEREAYKPLPNVNLLAVNRKIRGEAIARFYGANTFTIRADAFLPFLQDRTVVSLPLLRRVKVEMNAEISTSEDCPSRHQF